MSFRHASEVLPQRGAKSTKILSVFEPRISRIARIQFLSAKSAQSAVKTFCVFYAVLQLFIFQ